MKIQYGRTHRAYSYTPCSQLEVSARYGRVYFGNCHDMPEELTAEQAECLRKKLDGALRWAIAKAAHVQRKGTT